MNAVLSVQELAISFGNNHVLKSINAYVDENEILGVIGPNGAGKTVMLNVLTGILKPSGGSISFLGKDITNMKIVERVHLGLGRTFQIPRSFEHMTAFENIMVGGVYGRRMSEKEAGRQAWEIIETIGLTSRRDDFAGRLGLLDRKRLEIGVALASQPKLLMLDEVAGGLTESETLNIIEIVRRVKEQGTSVIWIEHVLQTMVDGTDRVMCLAEGRDVICGDPHEVMASPDVARVYLGSDEDDRDASLDALPPPAPPAPPIAESEVSDDGD